MKQVDDSIVMCAALQTDSNKRCGAIADYPLTFKDGFSMPLCWHHAQMIKSGWYCAVGNDIDPRDKIVTYRYLRTSEYGT